MAEPFAAEAAGAEPAAAKLSAAKPAKPRPAKSRERGGGAVRYLAGLMGLAALGPMLRRQAAQVGMAQARRWLGLTDGGGLDTFLEANFPGIVLILNFWRVAENLADFCKLFHATDPAAAAARRADGRHRLLHEGGLAVLRLVLNTDVQGCSEAVRDRHRRLLEYLRSNAGRMDYPTYVAKWRGCPQRFWQGYAASWADQ